MGKRPKVGGKRLIAGLVKTRVEDLHFLAALATSRDLRAVIDRLYPLADAAEAHAYVDTGRKRGSVVLSVRGPDR